MSKLFNFLSNKAHFKRKKIHGSFKWTPCGSGRKYKQCCGKLVKPMYLVDDVDNQESLRSIVLDTCKDLKK